SEHDDEKVNLPSPEPTISYLDDLDFFKEFENEFSVIVYNDAQTSKSDVLTEPILSPQHIDEFDLNDETSLSEYDEEEQNILYFNNLFPFNIIHPDDLKSENNKDDNDINIIQSSEDQYDVFDFGGLLDLMAEGLSGRMLMEHRDAQGAILDLDMPRALQFQLGGFKRRISSAGDFLGTSPSYTVIQDPILRLCHRLITCSIAGRSQAPEKVTMTDLFYLRGMDIDSVNVLYLLSRYLRLFAAGRKSGAHISRGEFVAYLVEHFGLPTTEILGGLTVISPELLIIDMAKQPDAAAGAPRVAQDAPVIDEGGQADPAPVHAPPPPAAARTMPQRMARLEEDVHKIRGALTEQHEVIDAMARDFSRFCTWTTTSLTRMMDRAGVKFTSYSQTPREYTRHVRRRTDGASTSTAQQGPHQPDP
ncbi:hypothetical protein Tco_0899708, partial [Tanacetum coccineum]